MIFVTNPEGRATFVSSEWTAFTGQSLAEAVGFGWTSVVHPDDREIARKVVADAIQAQCAFNLRYRMLAVDGRATWVAAGAVPSFGPPDRTFLGFLGSITPTQTAELRAHGSLGSFLPPPNPAARSGSPLELIADHLLLAHALIAEADAERLRPLVERTLHAVGVELARAEKARQALAAFH